MSKTIPLEENHELHGLLMGVATAIAIRSCGYETSTSLAIGGTTGTLAAAYMKTFGHPELVKALLPTSHNTS